MATEYKDENEGVRANVENYTVFYQNYPCVVTIDLLDETLDRLEIGLIRHKKTDVIAKAELRMMIEEDWEGHTELRFYYFQDPVILMKFNYGKRICRGPA